MLDKALVKFPVGVPRRWEQVTQYVRTRTQEEIVFMVKVCSKSRHVRTACRGSAVRGGLVAVGPLQFLLHTATLHRTAACVEDYLVMVATSSLRCHVIMIMGVQIKQGAHCSKFQQSDWRAGRKGGVGAEVGISANPDARDSAFTDVRAPASADSSTTATAAPHAATDTAASAGVKTSPGKAAPVATKGNSTNSATNGSKAGVESLAAAAKENKVENSSAWSKEQEMALLKALKTVSKDVTDRCACMVHRTLSHHSSPTCSTIVMP